MSITFQQIAFEYIQFFHFLLIFLSIYGLMVYPVCCFGKNTFISFMASEKNVSHIDYAKFNCFEFDKKKEITL